MMLKYISRYMIQFAILTYCFSCNISYAAENGTAKISAVVETVQVDSTLQSSLPTFYSADTLTRELETALEATGVFTVPTRDRREIEPMIAELKRAHGQSLKFSRARYIMEPVVTSIRLDMRLREVPHMRTKVLRSVNGSATMFVTVIDTRDASVSKRIPIEVHYSTPERLDDYYPGEYVGDNGALHLDAGSSAYIALCQTVGRAFAKRILDQVSPVFVAQRDGDRLFLTRGEDAGYRIGEVLRVIHRGGAIIHPVTHEVLGYDEHEVGQAEVIEVLPKLSIARITPVSSTATAGDIVREPVEEGGN